MTTHGDLITISQAIGGIAECSSWYTQQLSERIAAQGGLHNLTVTQLVEIDREFRDEMARKHAESLL